MLDKKIRELNPKVIYDIGAHIGQFTKRCSRILPKSTIHQFEANPNKKGSKNWHTVLLSDVNDKEITFYFDGGSGDTYYKETPEFLKTNYKEMKLKTKRLDTYIEENNIPLPDFIKIDVQGAELDILRGCDEIMNHCQLIHCEIPAKGVEFNAGAPTQQEYVDFLESFGFVNKTHLRDLKRNGRIVVQHDYMFWRD